MISEQTRQDLQTIYRICDAVERLGGKPSDIDVTLKELFIFDTKHYFMYLSASDGKVLPQEAEFMNDLFDEDFSVDEYVKRIDAKKIYSVDFENDVPLSLKIIALGEIRLEGLKDADGKEFPGLSSLIFDFYRECGLEFIGCDGDVSEQESSDLGMYLARKKMQLTQLLSEEGY